MFINFLWLFNSNVYSYNYTLSLHIHYTQNWNAYIGKLGHADYCFQVQPRESVIDRDIASLLSSRPPFNTTAPSTPFTHSTTAPSTPLTHNTTNTTPSTPLTHSTNTITPSTTLTTCVLLELDVLKKWVVVEKKKKEDTGTVRDRVLVASLTGREIGTQIKRTYHESHQRRYDTIPRLGLINCNTTCSRDSKC